MGPLALVPGVRRIMRAVPGIRTVGGSTSDLISLMLLVPGLAVAASLGEGEDEWDRILDYYTKKTFFGFGARWSMDWVLTMLAIIEEEDWDEYKHRANRLLSGILPPPLKETKVITYLLEEIFD